MRFHARSFRVVATVLAVAWVIVVGRIVRGEGKEAEDAALREKVERISREVERLRGLKFKRPVPIRTVTEKEAGAYVLKELEEDTPEETYAPEQRAIKALGLLPSDYRLKEELVKLLEVQAGGIYDPETGEMLLVDREQGDALRAVVLSHELTHALGDQHFNLKKLIEERPRTFDYEFALTGLIEGDATEVMSRYVGAGHVNAWEMLGEATGPKFEEANKKLADAPPFVRQFLLNRYLYGMTFVSHFASKGWKRVDEIYDDPPLSSEQVMHPEKYFPRRDFPTRIDLPDLSERLKAGKWQRVAATTLGEAAVMAMVETWGELLKNPALGGLAGRVGEGWDGDLLARFENDTDESVTVWISDWDRVEDAEEMLTALKVWVAHWQAGEMAEGFRRSAILEQLVDGDGKPGLDIVCILSRTRGAPPEWVDEVRTKYSTAVVRDRKELNVDR